MDVDNNNKNLYKEIFCDTKIVTESRSETVKPIARSGPVIVRVPVIISQTKVHINIESRVKLNRHVTDIRDCKKNAYVTNCKLVDLGNRRYGKIFMNGYIRENIEYVDAGCADELLFTGVIRSFTVKIPFEYITTVEYYLPPVLNKANSFIPVELSANSAEQREQCQFVDQLGKGTSCSTGVLCELEEVRIQDSGITKVYSLSDENESNEDKFDEIIEHMTVSIIFTLMQKQMVNIPRHSVYMG